MTKQAVDRLAREVEHEKVQKKRTEQQIEQVEGNIILDLELDLFDSFQVRKDVSAFMASFLKVGLISCDWFCAIIEIRASKLLLYNDQYW